jgi:hypothetical protein
MLREWKTIITDSSRHRDRYGGGGGCALIFMVFAMIYMMYKLNQFSPIW